MFTGTGTYTIVWIATDGSGNQDSCYQTVTVMDVTPPRITCPPDTVLEADETCSVTYSGPSASASDNCDGEPDVVSDPVLPATFNGVGDHEITWVASDESGNSDTCYQTVSVIDVTPPEITCPPDRVMEADENCQVVYVGPPASAADNCDAKPRITSEPSLPAVLQGVGDHYIEYTAADESGNTSTCVQTITIIDVTPPQIACPPDVALEPQGFDCSVTYNGPPAEAVDNCDESPVVISHPTLPATFGRIGDHLIVFEALDFSGNTSVCTMTVTVLPTSGCLKGEAIDLLVDLKPTGDDHLDKEIDKVIWHIEKSLDEELWLDVKHLDCKHGHKVFNEEKTATVHLVKEMNKKKFPPEFVDDFVAAINMLLDADEILAETQLQDAISYGGDEKHVEKARAELVLALEKREDNDYMHAIDHYRKAWDEACKAIAGSGGDGAQIGSEAKNLPEFRMSEGWPNPFRGTTRIEYQIPAGTSVAVKVYDLSGRLVRTVVEGYCEAGSQRVEWDGKTSSGDDALPGIYFVRLVAEGFAASRKIARLR